MEVKNKIGIYEINGDDVLIGKNRYLYILSHWNTNRLVVIKIGKKTWTVSRVELEMAIANAANVK